MKTGLNQARLQKRLAKVHMEENETDMKLAGSTISVTILGSFVSLLVSLFVPGAVFLLAGFLAMTTYFSLLRIDIQEDLDVSRQRYKTACDKLEELEEEFLRG